MDGSRDRLLLSVIGVAALAGCFGDGGPVGSGDLPPEGPTACVHPWPCGNGQEWPIGLAGPFTTSVEHVQVPSFDGVVLDGWLILPDLPDGTKAPVVLTSGPYWGQSYPTPENNVPPAPPVTGGAALFDTFTLQGHFANLSKAGYAVAVFNVRGSGNSGGCFDFFQPAEQQDQAFLVEWLGTQPWSNGRVAMMGLSYLGTTPIEAAVRNPPNLKTIVVTGTIPHMYTRFATPQGAILVGLVGSDNSFEALNTYAPPGAGDPLHPEYWLLDHLDTVGQRPCGPGSGAAAVEARALAAGDRDEGYWNDRDFLRDLPNVTASVLLAHGLQDGLLWQGSVAWEALDLAPKRQLYGQWGHEFPDGFVPDWEQQAESWLDFWLKGIGAPVGEGVVDYQDLAGGWHQSTAWPPADARPEALYLGAGTMASAPDGSSASFTSAPVPGGETFAQLVYDGVSPTDPTRPLCFPAENGVVVRYDAQPAASPTLLAGNPYALLRVTSDAPGGVIGISLFDVGPDFSCSGPTPQGATVLRAGAADLRFHQGNFVSMPFPVGTATEVRIDIGPVVSLLEPGHRLVALVGAGDPLGWGSVQQDKPRIVVHGDAGLSSSHLVVPIVEGTLGGLAPTVTPPPRPFLPLKDTVG